MSKLVLLNKSEAAKLVGMTKQLFHYYDREDRVPGLRIIGQKRFYNKCVLKGWKPKHQPRKNKGD